MTGLLGIQPARLAASAASATRPLGELLNADGSLDLGTGYQGSLEPAGWRMSYGAQGQPVFVPEEAEGLPAPQGEWYALGSGVADVSTVEAVYAVGADVYIGGDFLDAGGNPAADYIARWDGAAWQAVGDGLDAAVYDIEMVGPILCIGGVFSGAAAWTVSGNAWVTVGSGLNGYVYDLEVVGEVVYMGGGFTNAGDIAYADYLVGWNFRHFAWQPVNGEGQSLADSVFSLAAAGDDLYVGGNFTASDIPLNHIGRWNFSDESWHTLGSGLGDRVYALEVVGADVYAGGWFTDAGGNASADHIARWDGAAWRALGGGLDDWVGGIVSVGPNLYVSGGFTNAGGNLARWDGAVWNPVSGSGGGGLNDEVFALFAHGAELYAVGRFTQADGGSAARVARWDAAPAHPAWDDMGLVPEDAGWGVFVITIAGPDIYVGGNFYDLGGNPDADHIARWDGAAWQALGPGLDDIVGAIVVVGSDVYAGGDFSDAGGEAEADRLARWDGNSWHAVGSGIDSGWVGSIVVLDSDVYIGGSFYDVGGNPAADNIARWDGTAWQALGAGLDGPVYALAAHGEWLYAGGDFTGYMKAWGGFTWASMDGLNDYVTNIAVEGRNVYVGGAFTNAGGVPGADKVARWDGVELEWFALGDGLGDGLGSNPVSALAVAGPDVYVGTTYWQNEPGGNIAHWDGHTWEGLGGGVIPDEYSGSPATIAVAGPDLYAGGYIEQAGGNARAIVLARFGRIQPRSILFDETHDEQNTIDWTRAQQIQPDHPEWVYFGKLVQALGDEFTFTRNTSAELTLDLLSGYDGLLLAWPISAFSAAEQQAIHDYIATGGGVLVLGSCDGGELVNEFLDTYGLALNSRCLFGPIPDWNGDFDVTDFALHFGLAGADHYTTNWGTSLALDFSQTYLPTALITTTAEIWEDTNQSDDYDAGDQVGPFVMAAATDTGCGRLVAVSDNDFQDDAFEYRQNDMFMRTLLRWVTRGPICELQDTQAPTAAATCPAQTSALSFNVGWSGMDDMSGIATYDVQYRVGASGVWTDWPGFIGTQLTSTTFGPSAPVQVTYGQSYSFRTRAMDNAGNLGSYAPNGDCTTTVLPQQEFYNVYLPLALRRPDLSTLSDPAGDWLPGATHLSSTDILFASAERRGDNLVFTMNLAGNLPTSLPNDERNRWFWALDTDMDPDTGDPWYELGAEYQVNLHIQSDGYYVDVVDAYNHWTSLPGAATLSGSSITVVIPPSYVGGATRFNWVAVVEPFDREGMRFDIVPNSGFATLP